MDRLSDESLPLDAGDFRLVDRRVVEELRKIEDANPYIRGTIATMGVDQKGFAYDRAARTAGKTKFPLRALLRIAADGLLNHSSFPLRLATYVSLAIMALAMVLAVGYAAVRITGFGQDWPPGFTTIVLLLLVSTALNALFFGIQGEYTKRIFQQVKRRPLTIVEHELNPRPSLPFLCRNPSHRPFGDFQVIRRNG